MRKGSLAHRKPRKGVAVAIVAIFVVRSALATALRRLVPSKGVVTSANIGRSRGSTSLMARLSQHCTLH